MGPLYSSAGGYVARQRLVRQDPSAPSSEVVRPIVYTIDSTVPRRWVPWIRRAIESWGLAFEQIGFRHAVVIRDVVADRTGPQPATDLTGMPGCTVKWKSRLETVGLTTLGIDDDTGNITQCRIMFSDSTIETMNAYAFVFLGAASPAVRYPLPDSISGRIMQIVAAHEVGHSLGFDENRNAGVLYPTDSLHRRSFLRRFGTAPSVMTYAFLNNVARAADQIPLEDLILKGPGPMDVWALGWVYRPIPGARTSQDELPTLEQWRAVQDTAFVMHVTTNAISAYQLGNDQVASAAALLDNLAVVAPQIAAQAGSSEALLDVLQDRLLNEWRMILIEVNSMIGGTIPERPYVRDAAQQRTVPIDSARQVRALRLVLAHGLYGQDPTIRVLFGRPRKDSSVMLYAAGALGRTAEQWQEMQQRLLAQVLKRAPDVAGQAGTTHVLPVWCAAMRRLRGDLRRAQAGTTSPGERHQAEVLLGLLTPATDSTSGACHGV